MITKLQWDSDFFGFPVGRLTCSPKEMTFLGEEVSSFKTFKLIYVYSPIIIKEDLKHFGDLKFMERKVTFTKTLKEINNTAKNIFDYTSNEVDEKLLNLSILAGKYSRFNKDKNISKKYFHALYSSWIINSVNKIFARKVFVYKENEAILGFVTLSLKDDKAYVGLIAVDEKHRRKGIGAVLIARAEDWCVTNNFSELNIITQQENHNACLFYNNLEYKKTNADYVYHLWMT